MRKIFSLALAALLCLGLCACAAADSSSSAPSSARSEASSSQPESSAPPAASAADPGIDLSFYEPAADLPPYEPIPITESHYEGEYCTIDFLDLPENDAETLVCDEYYSWVMGEGPRVAALWWPGYYAPPLNNDYDPVTDSHEWIRVDRVQELTAAEAAGLPEVPLFVSYHEAYGDDLSYEDYVAAVMEAGCRVVVADYELLYTEEVRAGGPQIADGPRTEYWLLAPDAEGRLRLYANTRFYMEYALQPAEELNAPQLML